MNRKEAERLEDIQAALTQKDVEAYKFMLSDARGRWFVQRLFDFCGLNKDVFNKDTSSMCYNNGIRRVALTIHQKIDFLLGDEGISLRQQAERESTEYIKKIGG